MCQRSNPTYLSKFTPGPLDVICARGKDAITHEVSLLVEVRVAISYVFDKDDVVSIYSQVTYCFRLLHFIQLYAGK